MKIKILTLSKPGISNFALERNKLLKKSNSEWNLFLDSDEKLSGHLEFDSLKHDAFKMERKNYFLNQYVGTDKIVRFVKKGSGKWVRSVHEVWNIETSHSPGIIKNAFIIHNTADNLKSYINKINSYSTLHAIANKKEGKKSNIFKIIFYPLAKFIVTFVKSRHFVFSVMQSFHSFLSWSKLYIKSY